MNTTAAGRIVCEKPKRQDWVAMGEVYNQSVRNRSIPQLNPMTDQQSIGYFEQCEAGNVPTIVARRDGQVVGWLMAHPMVWGGITTMTTGDLCIYVDAAHTGKLSGVALRMISAGIRPMMMAGYERLTIWTYADNRASQSLAAAFGMQRWGLLPGVAKMDEDTYKDVAIWGVNLDESTVTRWGRVFRRLAPNSF